jgi:hypothetical protein
MNTQRFTTEYTSCHTYEYDHEINELRLCWPGDQTFLSLEECYSLLAMLNNVLPPRREQERPAEDSTEYLQDLNGHNQEVLWERAQDAAMPSDAQIEYEAEMQMQEPECPEGSLWNGRQCLRQGPWPTLSIYEREAF